MYCLVLYRNILNCILSYCVALLYRIVTYRIVSYHNGLTILCYCFYKIVLSKLMIPSKFLSEISYYSFFFFNQWEKINIRQIFLLIS